MAPALIVGLTGGIASGKSTVARTFRSLGVPVVDADEAARAVVAPGSPGLAAIREAFGDGVLTADGALDRAALRTQVFEQPEDRRRLEHIVHPRVREWMDARLAALDAPYAIRMVPLLVETGQHAGMDRVLVVDCPRSMQIERAMQRDGASRSNIEGILDAQASREQRLAAADDIIVNDGSLDDLVAQVHTLHARYQERAARLRADQQQ